MEEEVRGAVHRGTIQVNLRVDRSRSPEDYKINADVLDRYRRQLGVAGRAVEQWPDPSVGSPLAVAGRGRRRLRPRPPTPRPTGRSIERTLQAALENLARMRGEEGPRHGRRPDGQLPSVGGQPRSDRDAGAAGGRRLSQPAFRPAQTDLGRTGGHARAGRHD